MAVKREHVKTEETLNCYAVVDGKQIPLTPEMQRRLRHVSLQDRRRFHLCR